MFRIILLSILSGLGLLLAYLLLWPVPVSPLAWAAPRDAGLIEPYGANDRLQAATTIDLGGFSGPEDAAVAQDGFIYAATHDEIIRFRPDGTELGVFADTGGRPLGIEFDAEGNLVVANAVSGLQRISPNGNIETLVDSYDGRKIVYANSVAIAGDGRIFFTDSSSKFSAAMPGGTFAASLLDILEHGGHGRVFVHHPDSGETEVLLAGIDFANGIAISDDQQYLLVNETGHYRVLRLWLEGPAAGTHDVIIDNLPGFPDNLNNGLNGRFWVGLIAPRNQLIDDLADNPFIRKMILRLPRGMRPTAEPSSHVIGINGEGDVLMSLQDTDAHYPSITGVIETQQFLYLTTLFGNRFARLDKRDLE